MLPLFVYLDGMKFRCLDLRSIFDVCFHHRSLDVVFDSRFQCLQARKLVSNLYLL